ncbi:MAG TPA: hypothetical protein VMI32_00435 [Candidatus Solibacter sp.]|nr:hypothetical protein [Candidatus Solibacter sp.]
MLSEPVPEPKSPWKNPLLYSSIALAIVLLGVVIVMFSRWQDNRNIERQAARERAEKQRQQDQAAVEQLGGKEFTILDFYASPKIIRRGESAQLCYGVSKAKTVKLEPQSQPVWPSPARCVDVSPTKTTTYTLTIENAKGETESQTVDLKVR